MSRSYLGQNGDEAHSRQRGNACGKEPGVEKQTQVIGLVKYGEKRGQARPC